MSENSRQRFEIKRAAGLSAVRRDGSLRSISVDDIAGDVEEWFATLIGGLHDDSLHLSGYAGYDVVANRRGTPLRFDVVHAGLLPDGTPRPATGSSLIVDPDSNKLIRSDVLVLVAGPPFDVVGAIYTTRFIATAGLRDFGFGRKFFVPASALLPVQLFLPGITDARCP